MKAALTCAGLSLLFAMGLIPFMSGMFFTIAVVLALVEVGQS